MSTGSPALPRDAAAAWGASAGGARTPRSPGHPLVRRLRPLATSLFGAVLPLAVLTLAWGLSPGAEAWQLDLSRVWQEPWRLVTGHFVHWSDAHLRWDLAVFVGLGLACERHGRGRTAAALALAIPAVAFGAPLLTPGLEVYRGLSGLDAALFALLAAHRLYGSPKARILGAAALLGLGAKVGWEVATGVPLFVPELAADGVAVVPAAHLFGGAAGLLVGLLGRGRRPGDQDSAGPPGSHQ
ncbi:MAG TPA: rhombosortase [Thermoanaerobaculia bacterium]|nr:rhombosortase [Thermoanaerobaculia bacterium]